MSIVKNDEREFKLGMHSYTLHLSGCGESWGFAGDYAFERTIGIYALIDLAAKWGLDVLHITLVDLENDTRPEHLSAVKAAAEKHDLGLELNVSFNAPSDPRVNATVEDALHVGHAIGAELVKFSLDVDRPRPIYGSCLHPDVTVQLTDRYHQFKDQIELMEKYDMKVALENHCDMFADEVIWLVEKLHHPLVGACLDTMNSLVLMEGVEECVRKMTPYAYCVHFCDINIVVDPDGTHAVGAAIGQGDNDCIKIMQELRANAPRELDTINFEIELPMNSASIAEGRKLEMQLAEESIEYMRNPLRVGLKG